MTELQLYGPTGYHVHVKFQLSVPRTPDEVNAIADAEMALHYVEKTPCTLSLESDTGILDFTFYDLPIPDEHSAITRATYVLQEVLPRGMIQDMLVSNRFQVDTNPLGL